MIKNILNLILILLLSNILLAQQIDVKQNQITVIGSVELKEIADEASIYFSVKGVGESLRQAVEDAEKKTKNITQSLIQVGIKKNNISTSDFISGENYGDKAFLSSSRDYKAIIVTLIKTDSLDLLKPTIFTISESNVENISKISFSYKNELELRRRARVEAGLKAKEKAEDIGKSLGINIGKVLIVEEIQPTQSIRNQSQDFYFRGGQNYPNPFNPVTTNNLYLNEIMIDESKGSGFFAQTVSITSQVKVTFAIE